MINYEKKEFSKDKEYYISKCVIILQRIIRGFLLRYFLYKTIFRNNMPQNKHLRSLYSPWKIRELTKNICKAVDLKDKSVNLLINKIDEANKEAFNIRKKLDSNLEKGKKGEIAVSFNNSDDFWLKILKDVKKRDDNCPICFMKMWNTQVFLTSCSHCFHKNDLESFEKFDNYYQKRCPCCRQGYEKKLLRMI